MSSPRNLLNAWNLRARKRWGQNFLIHPDQGLNIIQKAGISSEDVVLEIGPGLGALTIPLARQAKQVVAVELDPKLIPLLKTECRVNSLENVEVIAADILELNLHKISDSYHQILTVMGNLPYNISSQIILHLIRSRKSISNATVMLQKEMAQRLYTPPGSKKYGRLSAMLQYAAKVERLAVLQADHFFPKPKIDSEVIRIRFINQWDLETSAEQFLFRIIKAAFANRRKTLKNSLSAGGLVLTAKAAHDALVDAGIDPIRRAETLSVEEFIALIPAVKRQLPDDGKK